MRALLRLSLGTVAIVAVLATVVVLVLRGPALSAGEVLLAIAAGAVGLTLLSAWVVVALQEREGPSEEEVEHAVRRSERLASEPAAADPAEPPTGFDELVAEAIDRLPDEFRSLLEDTPVVVSRRGRREGAYGHYQGDTVARDNFEDRIVIYQDTLERDFGHDPEELAAQIERTLRHELAHHLGWAERGVRDLGL